MFLSELSIRRPVTATMLILFLMVMGIMGIARMGVDYFPDVDFPALTVSTYWQNARPDEVDNDISDEIEDAIGEVSGVRHIITRSMDGASFIIVNFELSRNIDLAAQEVLEKVSGKTGDIPREAEKPLLERVDVNAQPVLWFTLYGRYRIEELTEYAQDIVLPMFQKLQGVGNVPLRGTREKQVRVWLERQKLAAYDLTASDVIAAIQKRHIEMPAGKIENASSEYLVRTMGEFETPEAMNELIVAYRHGTAVRLREVGRVESGREDNTSIARYTAASGSRSQGVGIGVTPRSGANKVAIARKAKDEAQQIRQLLPPGMYLELSSDRSDFIQKSIEEVRFHLTIGGLMAAVSIFFFLQNLSTTLIAAVAIPTSIVATFFFMYFMGFSMNNLTMLGLTMAVGLVVDDAIVMVENIFRHRRMGKSALAAALDGSREVGFAVVATSLALGGVFIPVAFMGGIVGKFFMEFGLTVAVAIAVSTFIALTLIPMLSSRFLRVPENTSVLLRRCDAAIEGLSARYRRLISCALRHRALVLTLAFAIFLCGLGVFKIIGVNFLRNEDESKFLVQLETPLSYSLAKTDAVVQQAESILLQVPEVSNFLSLTGFGGKSERPQSNEALIFVTLVPKSRRPRSQEAVMSELRSLLADLPDVQASVIYESLLGASSRDCDMMLAIRGPDILELDRISRELLASMQLAHGYVDLDRDLEIGKPEVQMHIRRKLCADLGVPVSDIAATVGALVGGQDVAEFHQDGKTYDVRVRLRQDDRLNPPDLDEIRVRTAGGELVRLSTLVDFTRAFSPSVINRLDRQRSVTIYANLDGKVLGDAIPEVNAMLSELLPPGYSSIYMGESEAFQETGYYISIAFFLAVLLTYMVLASQFESLVHPLTIMAALPLSFVGAFGMLWVTGNSFDLFGMIGLVLLVGLVTKNSILLIEFTNQKRAQGMETHQALIEAGAVRLRPILMTALSTVSGILPVALGLGIGSETRQPMALVVAGGMISSTVLTLLVIPVLYACLEGWLAARPLQRLRQKLFA